MGVATTLPPDPFGRILVPVVAFVLKPSERRFNVVPPSFLVKFRFNKSGNELAPLASANAPVQLGDQGGRERYVYSHVLRIAHKN